MVEVSIEKTIAILKSAIDILENSETASYAVVEMCISGNAHDNMDSALGKHVTVDTSKVLTLKLNADIPGKIVRSFIEGAY